MLELSKFNKFEHFVKEIDGSQKMEIIEIIKEYVSKDSEPILTHKYKCGWCDVEGRYFTKTFNEDRLELAGSRI